MTQSLAGFALVGIHSALSGSLSKPQNVLRQILEPTFASLPRFHPKIVPKPSKVTPPSLPRNSPPFICSKRLKCLLLFHQEAYNKLTELSFLFFPPVDGFDGFRINLGAALARAHISLSLPLASITSFFRIRKH
jgi:hypothetical protein